MRVKMIKYIIFLSSTKSFWKWQCSCCDSPSVHDDGIMVLCINALSPQSYTKYGQQYMTLNSLPSEVLYNIRAILERFFYDLLIYSIDSNLLASIGKYCPIMKLLLKVRDWHWKQIDLLNSWPSWGIKKIQTKEYSLARACSVFRFLKDGTLTLK